MDWNEKLLEIFPHSRSVLESKGMGTIFQKMGKIFENLGKNVQNLKMFWKKARDCLRQSHNINCVLEGFLIIWVFFIFWESYVDKKYGYLALQNEKIFFQLFRGS